jgi:PhnB protein
MAGKVKPIPEGYQVLTPYLICKDAGRAIEFYKTVLGAKEKMRMPAPDGKIGHAELQFGGSQLMLADEYPEMGYRGPQAIGGSPVSLHLYVEDVDGVFKRAISAGAKERQALENKFYGDRSGTIEDPFGHIWNLSSHVEDVPPEEMEKRAAAMYSQQQA